MKLLLHNKKDSGGEGKSVQIKKKGSKKRRIIATVLIVVILVGYLILRPNKSPGEVLSYNDTTVLAYSDFSNSISASGTVESASSMLVYSTLNYAVQDVFVSVGDYVEKGKLLAQLDPKTIVNQIESQETSMGVSAENSTQQIKTAQDTYDQYKYSLENGLNSSINSAKSQIDTSYDNYIKSVNTYERYREGLNLGENTTLLNQDNALRTAKASMDSAEDAYEQAKVAIDNAYDAWQTAKNDLSDAEDDLSSEEKNLRDLKKQKQSMLDQDPLANVSGIETQITTANTRINTLKSSVSTLKSTVTTKKISYDSALTQKDSAARTRDNAVESYETAKSLYNATATTVDDTLADYSRAADNAYKTYQDAVRGLDTAQNTAENQLQSYSNSLNSSQISANNASAQVSLRQLRTDLSSTKITAPTSGTVTAVYAKKGSSGTGLLFVIEDVNNLVVSTSVKEFDIMSVNVGMPVTIKAGATGNEVYNGIIKTIAPTSNKNAQGATDTTGDVQFATEVEVTSADTALRIGMTVRLNYIIDEELRVLSVPYGAVYKNGVGETCVLIADEQNITTFMLREVPVITGTENDLSIVVSGSGAQEGLRVVNEPDKYLTLIGKEIPMNSR